MMAFLSTFAAEFGARRTRLRQALGEQRATLVELALFLGLTLSALRFLASLEGWYWGLAPVLGAAIGALLLEGRRQSALAQGGDPDVVRRAYDRLTLILLSGMALLGAATFGLGFREPERARIAVPATAPEAPTATIIEAP